MKKNINLRTIFKTILIFTLLVLIGTNTVFATTAPDNLKIKSHDLNDTPLSFPYTFHVKKTTDGKYVYCMTYSKTVPNTNISYTKTKTKYTDPGIAYILEEGSKAKNDQEYFIAQTALWIYLTDNGKMPKSNNVTTFKSTLSKSTNATAKKIKKLVNKATELKENNVKVDNTSPKVTLSNNITFTLSDNGEYYNSNEITVTSNTGKYETELVSAPTGTTYIDSEGKITISVPVKSVTTTPQKIKLVAKTSKNITNSFKYTPNDSSYQVMAATYTETKNASDSISSSIVGDKVLISKQDVTTKTELAGATLEIKDEKGNIIDTWVSKTTPHELSLKPGIYTLTETIAPEGYEKTTEEITFEVGNEGITTPVVMYNTKKQTFTSKVSISKQDITTKTELAGARLEVINEEGNIVESWTSVSTPHIITGLPAGTYTLIETIAPNGYELSNEEITFTVLENMEESLNVVMYNEKTPEEEIEVPSTLSNKTSIQLILGLIILTIGSVLITKNIKKHHEK